MELNIVSNIVSCGTKRSGQMNKHATPVNHNGHRSVLVVEDDREINELVGAYSTSLAVDRRTAAAGSSMKARRTNVSSSMRSVTSSLSRRATP